MTPARLLTTSVSMLVAALLAACGGGGGGTGSAPAPGASAVSIGVMQKGSVIVNGVRFEDTAANIIIDDKPKIAADLRDGMVVKVLGTVNDDGINGSAQRVEAEIEVRGTVTAADVFPAESPQRLVVLGQTVLVDDQTVYSSLANVAAITTPTLIEVHGLRDTIGRIRATRIEANAAQMGDSTVDEIRGIVSGGSGVNPVTFILGSQAVTLISGAVIAPTGSTFQNGSVVEVHCSARPCVSGGVFQAARIEVEDAEDSAFQPDSGQRFEAEGLVSGFAGSGDSAFFVADVPVTISGSTRYVGGIATDLKDDIKVEAEGSWNGVSLAATKIEFKRTVVRLQGVVTASSSSSFTLNVANRSVSIEADSLTSGSVPPVGPDCVQVRGQRKAVGGVVVTAGEINTSCSNSDRPVMQAPVEAETPEVTIRLLGFDLDVSNPTDTPQWVDTNDQAITRTAFFNAVTPADVGPPATAGTLVKVIFRETDFLVRQVELED